RADLCAPARVDIDVAGDAGAAAPAFGLYAGHIGAQRRLHQRGAGLDPHGLAGPVDLHEGDGRPRPPGLDHAQSFQATKKTATAMAEHRAMLTSMRIMPRSCS